MGWGDNDVSLSPGRKAPKPESGGEFGGSDASLSRKKGAPQRTKTDQMLGFRKGLMKPLNKSAEWLEGGLTSLPGIGDDLENFTNWTSEVTGGFLAPSVHAAEENQKQKLLQARAKGVVPGKTGEFAGELLGTLPLVAATKNPYLLGAGQGALLSDAHDVQGVARDAATGALLGKAGDVAVGALAPVAKRAAGAAIDAIPASAKAAFARAAAPAYEALAPVRRVLPPRKVSATGPVGQAERYVRAKAGEKGLRSAADVNARAASEFADHPDVRAAELMGKEGEGILQTVARQGGDAGDMATAAMYGRLGQTPNRIRAAFTKLGIDPATADDDLVRMVKAGEERASQSFTDALGVPEGANAPGVWNDELAGLASDPMFPDIMKSAGLSARRRGGAAEGLTYGDVDIPGGLDDLSGFVESGTLRPAPPKGKGVAAVTGGTPLLQFIGRAGGLKHGANNEILGELRAMGADKWHVGNPYMNRLIGPVQGQAHDIEAMAEKAFRAGYFPERTEAPSPNEFLDMIRREVGESSRFARGGEAVERRAGEAAADEAAYHGETHPDDLPTPESYGDTGYGAPPEREPARMQAPTAQTWDLTRRKLNNMVDWRPSTPLARNEADDFKIMAKRLTGALAGDAEGQGAAIPGLRKALNESGDYIGLRNARRDFTGALFSNNRNFSAQWDRLAPGSHEGAKAALATEIMDGITSGRLKPKKFATEDARKNLIKAFGADADDFLRTMQAEARLVESGRRFNPDTNSVTQRLKMIQDEMASQGGDDHQLTSLADMIVSQNSVKGGALSWVRNQAANVIAKAKSVGVPVETRNEVARLMLLPKAQFAEFLQGPPQTEAQAFVQRAILDRLESGGQAARKAASVPATRPKNEEDEAYY